MKVALVYDRVNKWGGAERVLLALHKIFPKAPLYTSVYNSKNAPWAKVFKIKTSFLQNFPFAKDHHELYATLMPLAFESFNFDTYDLVISVTSEAAKGIVTGPKTIHICYCLTPTRYLWSGYGEYFKSSFLRLISKPVVYYLKNWDREAAKRPDKIVAISEEVKKRIKKYYDRDSQIIYPPLGLSPESEIRNPRQTINSKSRKANSYFLVVSRLVPYKKVDLVIRVFNKLKLPLKIIGTGSEEKYLKSISKENIEFLGYLTDKELVKYYRECQALIFPGKEDFGLTIVEAQSFGKPVIAYGKGGARETIVENKTGLFFENQSIQSLEKAIKTFMKKQFNPEDCIAQSGKFSMGKFEASFEKLIGHELKKL